MSVISSRQRARFCVSLVVDDVADHAYKAEILLLTLMRFGGFAADDIFVHCLDRVSADIVQGFVAKGVNVTRIAPYLDGTYCNKLQQLPALLTQPRMAQYEGVYLLDSDIAIAASLEPPDPSKVWGKIVDIPNPPLADLQRIFAAAAAPLPDIVQGDMRNDPTLAGNCNGGVIYIPFALAGEIAQAWRTHAEFLFARRDLFSRPSLAKHVDQVSFALALATSRAPYGLLSSNHNLPLQFDRLPAGYNPAEPVIALHYHWCLSPFGLIAPAHQIDGAINDAVKRINHCIADAPLTFFAAYKQRLANEEAAALPSLAATHPLRVFLSSLPATQRPQRIILHVGTPKTGTTALQFFLNENRAALKQKNICYPPALPPRHFAPKHQFLMPALLHNNAAQLVEGLAAAFSACEADDTLVLSTEGIYNHWWDFGAEARAMLRHLASAIPLEIWIWFRDPVDFARSFYIQSLKNASSKLAPCFGKDMSPQAMMEQPWFIQRLDYLGFLCTMQALAPSVQARVFFYTGETIADFIKAVGMEAARFTVKGYEYNVAPSALAIRLLRRLNRWDLPQSRKRRIYAWLQKLDFLLKPWTKPMRLDAEVVEAVTLVSTQGWKVLQCHAGWRAAKENADDNT